jgi:protein subunit release factor B
MSAKILPWIPKDRLDVRFSRSSGPGGQGVNRTESKVEMRFRLSDAEWLSPHARDRLRALFSGFINSEDEFIVTSQESRSQKDNYEICLEKLSAMITRALAREKKRIATQKTRSSERKRLRTKSVVSAKKRQRGLRSGDDD